MREEVIRKVKECVVEAVGVRFEEIRLDSQLVNDLGADSLDLVELMYQLETAFGISLQRGAIMDRIKKVLPEDQFIDAEGNITSQGREVIKREVPELANVSFAPKLSFTMLVSYFTVEVFVNLIMRAQREHQQTMESPA